jgi:hypothetical protein
VLLVVVLAASACTGGNLTAGADEPTGRSPSSLSVGSRSAAVTVVAAGDIGKSPSSGELTADLVEAAAPDAVLTLGDNAYDSGTLGEYRRNYAPTWGRFKRITRPVPGNHEYGTRDAAGYFAYFRRQVARSHSAWNAGAWRMYALNCEIECGEGSVQLAWLERNLRRHQDRPALAYLHRPRYTCSKHEPFRDLDAIWDALQARSGQLLLSGHNHGYERFARQDSSGRRDPDGVRQLVVGSGGADLYPLSLPCQHRQAAIDDVKGVLVLRLRPDGYRWQFVGVDGVVRDEGRGSV